MNSARPKGRKNRRACLLISGGLDSCVLLDHLADRGWDLTPLYVRAGLVWEGVELIWIRRFLAGLNHPGLNPLRQLSLPVEDLYRSHWSTTGEAVPGAHSEDSAVYLPGRNLLLLSKAAVYCALNRIGVIFLGPLKGNPFPDSTPAFFRGFERLASRALTHPLEIAAPFGHLSKAEVIGLGRELPLELTFSCIRPVGEKHCGACNKCAERRRSFAEAAVEDKITTSVLPWKSSRARPGRVIGNETNRTGQAPFPSSTMGMVFKTILMSRSRDHLSIYCRSNFIHSSKSISFLPRTCHKQVSPGFIRSLRRCQRW